MPTQATRIIVNAATGQTVTETYEIPDPTPEEIAAAAAKAKEETISRLESALEQHIDRVAFENGRWRNIQSAIAAASLTGPFQAQAATLAQFWTDCWEIAIQIMNDAEVGNIAVPTEAELIAMLPVYGS